MRDDMIYFFDEITSSYGELWQRHKEPATRIIRRSWSDRL